MHAFALLYRVCKGDLGFLIFDLGFLIYVDRSKKQEARSKKQEARKPHQKNQHSIQHIRQPTTAILEARNKKQETRKPHHKEPTFNTAHSATDNSQLTTDN